MKCLALRRAITLIAVLSVFSGPATFAGHHEEKSVQQAVEAFYAALNAMFKGQIGPMEEVWSHAADVTYMGPAGGLRVGWDEVSKDWQAQAAMKLGGEVHAKDLHITVGRDLAVVNNWEIGDNEGPDGKPMRVEIRATSVVRKEVGQWKMIGHQTDLLPSLQE